MGFEFAETMSGTVEWDAEPGQHFVACRATNKDGGGTRIDFTPDRERRWMPVLLGFLLVALFIWFAENIGTFARAWTYPSQNDGWHMVGLEKLEALLAPGLSPNFDERGDVGAVGGAQRAAAPAERFGPSGARRRCAECDCAR